MSHKNQPIAKVEWVDPKTLRANDYNPNHVFGPELELLKLSIVEDGWTQAIVVGDDNEIIDGFHRWTLGKTDPDIRKMSDGLVPIVRRSCTRDERILATVRHNRARGQHGILKMAALVRELIAGGMSDDDIERRLGMEREERTRLSDFRSAPEKQGYDSFGRGWVPSERA